MPQCSLQLINASSLSVPQLLSAAYHRAGPHTAVAGSGNSQEMHRKLRSPTYPSTAGSRRVYMAVLERFQSWLAISPGDQWLVVDGP